MRSFWICSRNESVPSVTIESAGANRAQTNSGSYSFTKRSFTVANLCHTFADTLFLPEKDVSKGGLDKALRSLLSIGWSRSFYISNNQLPVYYAQRRGFHTPAQIFSTSSPPPIIHSQAKRLTLSGGQYPQNDSSGCFDRMTVTQQTTSGVESGRACDKCIGMDVCNQISNWTASMRGTEKWKMLSSSYKSWRPSKPITLSSGAQSSPIISSFYCSGSRKPRWVAGHDLHAS